MAEPLDTHVLEVFLTVVIMNWLLKRYFSIGLQLSLVILVLSFLLTLAVVRLDKMPIVTTVGLFAYILYPGLYRFGWGIQNRFDEREYYEDLEKQQEKRKRRGKDQL